MKNPRALRHKVDIQYLSTGSPQFTPEGEPDAEWAYLLRNVSAEWVTLRGSALFAAQQQHAEVRGIWRIRWRDEITAGMRIVHRGLYYDILFVPPVDRNGKRRDMDLEVSQGVTLG